MRGAVVASHRRVSAETGRHAEALDKPPPSFAAQGEGNVALNIDEALGAPGGGLHNPRQALGEGVLRATGFLAQEPACLEAKNYRPALPWQIGQMALIMAVHPRRRRVAAWARN
ncbi:hypothetical protein GCM10022293_00070 [Azospirillum formosense]